MDSRDFFKKINFNKSWNEADWEKYFDAHEAYRLSVRNAQIRKKPMEKIKFVGEDEVEAFDPILREYGTESTPLVFNEIKSRPFIGDQDPDEEYTPSTLEDPHFWGEGAPLATLAIYRDCCRFAIATSNEIDRYLKRRDPFYRRKHSSEFKNLRFHANWVAINIAQGHHIGYSKDRIQGNIAKTRRAIQHADACMASLNRISRSTKSRRLRDDLFSFAAQIRNTLYLWLDELRERLG